MTKSSGVFEAYPEWSNARFFGFIRSALRKASLKWPPRNEAKKRDRRKYAGENKRQKYEYNCKECGGWFSDKEVDVDHIEEVGTLRSFEDLPGFVKRMFCPIEGFRILCKECHKNKTNGKTNKT